MNVFASYRVYDAHTQVSEASFLISDTNSTILVWNKEAKKFNTKKGK